MEVSDFRHPGKDRAMSAHLSASQYLRVSCRRQTGLCPLGQDFTMRNDGYLGSELDEERS